MNILVTGANGFVGRRLTTSLLEAGHRVRGAAGPDSAAGEPVGHERLTWVPLDLRSDASVHAAADGDFDAVVHLAGASSGASALRDPGSAWEINAAGTARLAAALGSRGKGRPLLLAVSTSDVYAAGFKRPIVETDPVEPRSPYAASKLGAELAARETAARTGLRVIVARPFPHTGAGQDDRFVAPAFARRLAEARRSGDRAVPVGNLAVTRDFLDVRDVVAAYLALITGGVAGETYNIATGRPVELRELFSRLAALIGTDAAPAPDPVLIRAADAEWAVGDASKLRAATGWQPQFSLEDTLRDLVNAQAH